METLLVTGAAGTVGNYVASLAEAAGYRVIATDRVSTGLRTPVRGAVRTGDLRDPEFVRELMQGVDHVIHTAAQLEVGADPAELARTNTEAVALLYESAEQAGVKRFIHTSTAMLYDVEQEGPFTEHSPLAPRGPHGLSKHGAEIFLRGHTHAKSPQWTIVRAAPIYGRRGRHFASSLLAVGPIVRLFVPILPRLKGGPMTTLVHAEDVASALLFCLKNDATIHQIFNVADNDPLPLGERLTQSFEAYGLTTMLCVTYATPLVRLAERLMHQVNGYAGVDLSAMGLWKAVCIRHQLRPALRPRLDREALVLLHRPLVIDNSKLRSLGWTPRFSKFIDGWNDVLRWYQAEKWVPRYH